MSIWEAALLGVIQALTEFLPVSSSGHLVLFQNWLHMESAQGATFEVAVHLGTLLSVLCFFYKDLKELVSGVIDKEAQSKNLLTFILVSSIPAGIIGVLFKDDLEKLFGHTDLVAGALCITGLILILTLWLQGNRDTLKSSDAVWIGLAQAFAIIPGISRSGSTIAMALFLGLSRVKAARLSFLMSIPVVGGAGFLKMIDCIQHVPSTEFMINLAVGAAFAFIVGLWSLSLMLKWVQHKAFSWFGVYCICVGAWNFMSI